MDKARLPSPRNAHTSAGVRIFLIALGVTLGVTLSALARLLPGSPPLMRLQSLWKPALRNVWRGEAALAAGNTREAVRDFDSALAQDPARAPVVAGYILEACLRQQVWDLALKYGHPALETRPGLPQSIAAANQVRYGEALMGLRRWHEAQNWFERVLTFTSGNDSSDAIRASRGLAERDLSYVLTFQRKDLTRAQKVAEDGIREQLPDPVSRDLLASLNDALAWSIYQSAILEHSPQNLALAQIYIQNARNLLPAGADPSFLATILFHESAIQKALGSKAPAAEALRRARLVSEKTVAWLQQDPPPANGKKTPELQK